MKRCPFCNADVPDYAVTCRFCGQQLGSSGPRQAPGAKSESQVLTLIMGILALVCIPIGPIFAIVAIALWAVHRGKVKKGLARPDGTATAGLVLAVIGIVLTVMAIVMMVAVWSNVVGTIGEPFAAAQLQEIRKAQELHQQSTGQFATELSQLEAYGLAPIEEMSRWFKYDFHLRSSGDYWSCIASPIGPTSSEFTRRYLYIDQEGTVRCSPNADVNSTSPEYHMPNTYENPSPPRSG